MAMMRQDGITVAWASSETPRIGPQP
jgi:hypothetical protein